MYKICIASVVNEWDINMERCWYDTDRGKLKYWRKNVPRYYFAHQKSHLDWLAWDPVYVGFFCGQISRNKTVVPYPVIPSRGMYTGQ
jgi:hypothetical protein